ncbi:MAG TPA: GntR family transcriptional regulator [Streptosporangiaceae bacterium]|jgi:DNA-binding FadR family transcriptional regulator
MTGGACPFGGRTVSTGLFAPARPVRLVDDVAGQLRDGIADGRLPYGTRLCPDGDLAEQFAVPPMLLREALRLLRAEGLLGARTDEHNAIVFVVRAPALRAR